MTDNWESHAACRGMNTALFFPDIPGDHTVARAAKEVCRPCPVRRECLEEHLWEQHGVFGGLTPKERRAVRSGTVPPVRLRACDWCTRMFPAESNGLYCTTRCRQAAYKWRRRAREVAS